MGLEQCPECGFELADKAPLCTICGAKQPIRGMWSVAEISVIAALYLASLAFSYGLYLGADDESKFLWLALTLTIVAPGVVSIAVLTALGAIALFSIASDSNFVGVALYVVLWVIASPLMIVASLLAGAIGLWPNSKASR